MNKSDELCRLLGIENYPDLTNPSNFVKLLKLRIGETSIGERYGYCFTRCNTENEVIHYLILNWQTDLMVYENLQQQAQQTDWEY